MIKNRIFKAALLVIALLSVLVVIIACDSAEPADTEAETVLSGKTEYTVSVTDYKGDAPEEDVLVEVKQGDETVGMKKASDNGKVSFTLERGDYTFTLSAAGGDYYYDEAECVLSAEKTEAEVAIYARSKHELTIYPSFDGGEHSPYDAALIGEGATYVDIDRDDIAYYIFTPTRGGIYRVSCIAQGEVGLGYYGDANVMVRTDNIAKLDKDGAFQFEIKNGSVGSDESGTVRIVIGLSTQETDNAIIIVERISDPVKEVSWNTVSALQTPESFERTDMINHTLVSISVTDPDVKVVYNENDGYYHYGSLDGAVVYIRICSKTEFLSSFSEICETAMMCRVYYDDDGNVTRKDSYNSMIASYAEICDGNGVCPLTKELALMVQNVGEHMGWWDFSEKGNQIFTNGQESGDVTGVTESNIVMENAWLFAACYLEQFTSGGASAPIKLTVSDKTEYYAELCADEPLYLTASAAAELKISDAVGLTVLCGGNTYVACESGELVITTSQGDSIEIVSDKDGVIALTYTLCD